MIKKEINVIIVRLHYIKIMKLEQSDNSLLFSETSIPDVFFTEYFPQSNSDSIMVYLYLFFLSKILRLMIYLKN